MVSGLGSGRTGLLLAETVKTWEHRSGVRLWTSSSEMPPGQAREDVEQKWRYALRVERPTLDPYIWHGVWSRRMRGDYQGSECKQRGEG